MRYNDENNFQECHRIAIDGVARVVAYVCGIGIDELKSNSRKRCYADARKMVCMYTSDNIKAVHYHTNKSLALSAWYFQCDHSTVNHAIDSARFLYKTDDKFSRLYDSVVEFIENPSYDPDFTYSDLYSKKKTWDDVRMNINELQRVRYSFMPQYVKEDITALYKKGYGELTIAYKVGTTLDFINYFIEREKLTRNKVDKVKQVLLERRVEFNKSMKVDY